MRVQELTHENFDDVTDRPGVILIDFWAAWCAPCKAFAPVYEAAAEKYPEILFTKIDADAQQVLAQQFEVKSIPTMLAVKDGEIVGVRVGALPPAKLEAFIKEIQR